MSSKPAYTFISSFRKDVTALPYVMGTTLLHITGEDDGTRALTLCGEMWGHARLWPHREPTYTVAPKWALVYGKMVANEHGVYRTMPFELWEIDCPKCRAAAEERRETRT